MWFKRGYTTPALTANQLNNIVQSLVPVSEAWYTTSIVPVFTITVSQYWHETEDGVEWEAKYKIYFPSSVWKKICIALSDSETVKILLKG